MNRFVRQFYTWLKREITRAGRLVRDARKELQKEEAAGQVKDETVHRVTATEEQHLTLKYVKDAFEHFGAAGEDEKDTKDN